MVLSGNLYSNSYVVWLISIVLTKSLFPGPLPASVKPANKPKPPQQMKATEKKGSQMTSNMGPTESYHIMGPSCYTMTHTGYKYKGKGPSTHLPTSNKYVV